MDFPGVPSFVRADPFGPTHHNNVLRRQDYLYDALDTEHDPATGAHNTIHVPRTVGLVHWDGAAYSLLGFQGLVTLAAGHNPSPGVVILTLSSGYFDATQGIVELQAGDSLSRPWVWSGEFTDATHVKVRLWKDVGSTGVGGQQDFQPTDGDFYVAIRSPRIADSVARPTGAVRRAKGDGLAVDSSNWNPMVQAMGTNRAALLAKHNSDGLHNCAEVARAWAIVGYDASIGYNIIARDGIDLAPIAGSGVGNVRLSVSAAKPAIMGTEYCIFAKPLAAPTGEVHTGLRIAVAPRSSIASSNLTFRVGLWGSIQGSTPTQYAWDAVDCSFMVRVYDAL